MLFISQVVPKGWKGAGGTASIHCSSSKHPSHKHDPNLSGVVKDVLISPCNSYLLEAVRQFPKPAAQLQAGCWPQEPLITAEPTVARDLQGRPGIRCQRSPREHTSHAKEEARGDSHLATQQHCNSSWCLYGPLSPGSLNPSIYPKSPDQANSPTGGMQVSCCYIPS